MSGGGGDVETAGGRKKRKVAGQRAGVAVGAGGRAGGRGGARVVPAKRTHQRRDSAGADDEVLRAHTHRPAFGMRLAEGRA